MLPLVDSKSPDQSARMRSAHARTRSSVTRPPFYDMDASSFVFMIILSFIFLAGPDVQTECLRHIESHGNLSEGSAVFTNAGNLTCREILHVVGPVWKDGQSEERNILQTAVWKVLAMVTDRKYLSVMIPAISCGVLGFPNDKATEHIVQAIYNFVSNVSLCCIFILKDSMHDFRGGLPPPDLLYRISTIRSVENT